MVQPAANPFYVGSVRVDPERRSLSSSAGESTLEPKVMSVLLALACQQGVVVTRRALLDDIWAREYGGDESLTRAVSLLRKALGGKQVIETVPKRGYRLRAEVRPDDATLVAIEEGTDAATPAGEIQSAQESIAAPAASANAEPPADIISDPKRPGVIRQGIHRVTLATLVLLAAVIALYLGPLSSTRQQEPALETAGGIPTLAVLPFRTSVSGEDGTLIAIGVMDDLLTQLSKVSTLRVISRRAVLAYRDTDKSPQDIGAELNSQALLTGTVHLVGDRFRLGVQLLGTAGEGQLWAETYDRPMDVENLFEIQTEVARSIARVLSAKLTKDDQRQIAILPTDNMAAYQAFHRALSVYDEILGLYLTTDSERQLSSTYLNYLEQAVGEDPRFIRAWAELVHGAAWLSQSGDAQELSARAEEGLEVLRKLAPESAEFSMAQAAYLYYTLRDYEQALAAIERAIRRLPGEIRFHQLKYFIARRNHEVDLMREATQGEWALDPNNPVLIERLSWSLRDPSEGLKLLARIPPGQDYGIDFSRSFIRASFENDPAAHAERVRALADVYPEISAPHHLWYAQMMAGDFTQALVALDKIQQIGVGHALYPLTARQVHGLLTYYYGRRQNLLDGALAEAEEALSTAQATTILFQQIEAPLAEALVHALRGEHQLAQIQVQQWERSAKEFGLLGASATYRSQACFILAISLDDDRVLACLREAIDEGSWAGTATMIRHWPGFAFLEGNSAYEDILDDFGT